MNVQIPYGMAAVIALWGAATFMAALPLEKGQTTKEVAHQFRRLLQAFPPPLIWLVVHFSKFFLCSWLWLWRPQSSPIQNLAAVITAATFVYLVIDLRYQGAPTISSTASDPTNPFAYPFTFSNGSRLFGIYNVTWSCRIATMVLSNGSTFTDVSVGFNSRGEALEAGQSTNLDCSHSMQLDARTILSLKMAIDVSYDIYFFWLFPRNENQTAIFTWYANTSNPQWIKGNFIGGILPLPSEIAPACPPPRARC